MITKDAVVNELLGFYMGKNTPQRQDFIIENLKVEKDLVGENDAKAAREGAMLAIARKLEENEVEIDV
jgi:topoisomerase-4 subunit B